MQFFKLLFLLVPLSAFMVLVSSCQQETAYQKMERLELSKGTRYDTLFFGYYFGMPKKEFYDQSWKINKAGLVTNGDGAEILCRPQGFKYDTRQLFYPEFAEDKIVKMWMRFNYDAYNGWNPRFGADSLLKEVIPNVGKWFGVHDFMEVEAKDKPKIWVNVTGNRRLMIYKEDDKVVKVLVSDLSVRKKEKNQ
jgi:hypothetical protein